MVSLRKREREWFGTAPGSEAAPVLLVLGDAGGRRQRRDALPEHTRYADTGCDLHPSCLSCPLERCRYDEPGGLLGAAKRDRDGAILSARFQERMTVRAIARRFGISRRTVFRVLARAR